MTGIFLFHPRLEDSGMPFYTLPAKTETLVPQVTRVSLETLGDRFPSG